MKFGLYTLGLVLAAASVQADSMQCGTHVIEGGELVSLTEEQVLRRCGEPKDMDNWVYDRQGGRGMRLHFENGQLQSIQEMSPD